MKTIIFIMILNSVLYSLTGWYEVPIYPKGNMSSIFFIDGAHGWITGEGGLLFYSNDGGDSWSIQNSKTAKNLNDTHFITSTVGWAVGDDNIILEQQRMAATHGQ